jgi:redox-sensitive bicupin YhaK (pirin superfamily)
VTVVVRRGSDRFFTQEPGRQTGHSFSFGSSYDPERLSFGPLTALNDDLLADGAGYADHEHSDVVLVTWVVTGALAHADADGRVVQRAGQLAVARAGTGITHSERATGGVTRFVQSWLRPGRPGGRPDRRTTAPALAGGDLVVVADEDALGVPGATLRIGDLPGGATVSVPEAALRYLFVATGALARSSLAQPLSAGDAFEITGGHRVEVTAAVSTQVLVWSFDRRPSGPAAERELQGASSRLRLPLADVVPVDRLAHCRLRIPVPNVQGCRGDRVLLHPNPAGSDQGQPGSRLSLGQATVC